MPGGTGNQPTLNPGVGGLVQYGNPGGRMDHQKEVHDMIMVVAVVLVNKVLMVMDLLLLHKTLVQVVMDNRSQFFPSALPAF